MEFWINAYVSPEHGGYSLVSYCKVWGQRKYACIWGNYRTNLTLKDMQYRIVYEDPSVKYPGIDCSTDHLSSEDAKELFFTEEKFIKNELYPEPGESYYFEYFTGTFKSRGVGNAWGTGSCGI